MSKNTKKQEKISSILADMSEMMGDMTNKISSIKTKLVKNIANEKDRISKVYQEIEGRPYNSKIDSMVQKYTSESLKSISDAINQVEYKDMYDMVNGCNDADIQSFVRDSDSQSVINCLGQIEDYIINH